MLTLSVVIPVYNESANIEKIHTQVLVAMTPLRSKVIVEFVFVNDGSTDQSQEVINHLASIDPRVKFVEFSRNFGKEIATTAGLNATTGDAVLIMDCDLQHPPSLIPQFIEKFQSGLDVVVGLRTNSSSNSIFRRLATSIFNRLISVGAGQSYEPGGTDFRLLSKRVVDAFQQFRQKKRMTRTLIDWMGFKRGYIEFTAPSRIEGTSAFGFTKLFGLAMDTLVTSTLWPLRVAGYLGIFWVVFAGLAGLYVLIGKYVFASPFASSFTGPAELGILLVFLVGIVLCSQGILAMYVESIHQESLDQPLYIIRTHNLKHSNNFLDDDAAA